jgi:hypothetical protein
MMNFARSFVTLAVLCMSVSPALAFPFLTSRDPLAPSDEWGKLHQMPWPEETDYARRESWRLFYYNKSRHELARDPAYIGAVQRALHRNGYYCGPIDGIFSTDVTDAIARLQKNHNMRVTGNLTVAVRRALFLP